MLWKMVATTWCQTECWGVTANKTSKSEWMDQVRPNTCSPVVSPYLSRTYWDHGHSDAHGCEHRVGHCAALIAQPDAVVIAEESSVVRREGRLVQKHGNKQHCMVGHTSLSPVGIFNRKKTNRKADEDSNSADIKKTPPKHVFKLCITSCLCYCHKQK